MACLTATGKTLDCLQSVGGVKTFFLYDKDTEGAITKTDNEITDIGTMTLYRFDMENGVGDFTETANTNVQNSTLFYEQVVNMAFATMSKADKAQFDSINRARIGVFALDNNDEIHLLGEDHGFRGGGSAAGSGADEGDRNGFALVLTARNKVLSAITQPFTAVPFDNYPSVTVEPAYT